VVQPEPQPKPQSASNIEPQFRAQTESEPATEAKAEPKRSAPTFGRQANDRLQVRSQSALKTARNALIVDDSRMIRKVARQILEKRGYKVSEAENGQEALEKCAIALPDLIILDWDMPVMTGIDFLAELRARETAKRPQVVFCTTHSGAKDVHKAVELGADEFCTKPFNETGLTAKLEAIGAA